MPDRIGPPVIVLVAMLLASCGGGAPIRSDEWTPGAPKRLGPVAGEHQHGTWTYWYPDGAQQARGGFRNDRQDGGWTWWHPNGAVQQEGAYERGLRKGRWRFFHPDGTLAAEGGYGVPPAEGSGPWSRLDRQHGAWRFWHPNGALAAFGWFDGGVKTLLWTAWDERGRRLEQGAYWQGFRVGPWLERGEGGERLVDHGCPAGFECYREPAAGQPTRWGMLRDQRPAGLWLAFTAAGTPRIASLACAGHERWTAWLPDGRPLVIGEVRGQGEAVAWFDGAPGANVDDAREREVMAARRALRAPLLATIARAPIATPTINPGALTRMPLSPQPVLPGFWTAQEEASAALLVEAYAGTGASSGGRTAKMARSAPSDPRAALLGKPLPPTRLLGADGELIDLADLTATMRRTLVVVLRGFSGQVGLHCAAQSAAIAQHIARFAAAETAAVLVYPGPTDSLPHLIAAVRSLGTKLPPRLRIMSDPDLLLVRRMTIEDQLAKPTALLLDRSGWVRWVHIGAALDDRPTVDQILAEAARVP